MKTLLAFVLAFALATAARADCFTESFFEKYCSNPTESDVFAFFANIIENDLHIQGKL